MARKDADGIAKALRSRSKEPERKGLSTGSTLLNLGCSGSPDWGLLEGQYYLLVGDSDSGKTFLSMTCMAEACLNPAFRAHRLVRWDGEDGALMDVRRFFGADVARKLEVLRPSTAEEFYWSLDDELDKGDPLIGVLDSMDSLSTEDDKDKFQAAKKAARKGREESGSYGTSKAKRNSAGIREILPKLQKTGSILIVISQTRDNIGFGSQFNPKVFSGGHALKFYATLQLWSSKREEIKKPYKGKQHQAGIVSRVQVKKNRLTGRHSHADIPIYWSHGIDDVGGMVDWLVEVGEWEKSARGMVMASDFGEEMTAEKLVQFVQDNDMEDQLRELVADAWRRIEEACSVRRKKRYE